jgi:hypothetical protein
VFGKSVMLSVLEGSVVLAVNCGCWKEVHSLNAKI